MRTRILTIVGKQRPHHLALVSLDDFQYQQGDAIDPQESQAIRAVWFEWATQARFVPRRALKPSEAAPDFKAFVTHAQLWSSRVRICGSRAANNTTWASYPCPAMMASWPTVSRARSPPTEREHHGFTATRST
jgi:hypothetical protein